MMPSTKRLLGLRAVFDADDADDQAENAGKDDDHAHDRRDRADPGAHHVAAGRDHAAAHQREQPEQDADAGKDDVQNADHFQHGFALWCHKIVLLTM